VGKSRRRPPVLPILLFVLAACGRSASSTEPENTPIRNLLIVDETLPSAFEIGEELSVAGLAFTTVDGTRLCQGSMDSRPPICDGARIALFAADLTPLPTAETLLGVTWAESVVAVGVWEAEGLRVTTLMSIVSDEPTSLIGTVVASGGDAVLCARTDDAEPPRCLVTAIPLIGLDLAELPEPHTAAGVTWADGVVVVGTWGEGINVSRLEPAP
jgi:hypothetical protein